MDESTTSDKVRKLRSSCEDCGNAKVRCDRGQPGCSRCIERGVACVYRLSRKFGKPPRKKGYVRLNETSSFPYKKPATVTAGSYENRTAMESEQPSAGEKSARPKFADPVAATQSMPFNIDYTSNTYPQNRLNAPFVAPLSFDEWPQLDTWVSGLEFPSFSNDSGLDCQLPASALEPFSNFNNGNNFLKTHSCPRGSYELFRDLICPGPFLHAPGNSDTVSARLDQVLHFNRSAIDRLSQLLRCPCARSGHRVMVHASIVSRILIWYQQAAGWTGNAIGEASPYVVANSLSSDSTSSSTTSPAKLVADTNTTGSPILAKSTGFDVTQVPISMGTFNIEDENIQTAIRNQLVLSELKKTARLIDHFTFQGSSECSDPSVTSLCSHLGVWLQNEQLRTVNMLKAKLGAMNEV